MSDRTTTGWCDACDKSGRNSYPIVSLYQDEDLFGHQVWRCVVCASEVEPSTNHEEETLRDVLRRA